MDITTVTSLIGTLGFPIAMCLIMFWYMNKERESHEEEIKSLTESLNNNTQILTELKTLLTNISSK